MSVMRYDPWAQYCGPIPCTTNTRSCCSHVTGNLKKIWCWPCLLDYYFSASDNSYKVTNSSSRRIQEPNFCHNSCKNLSKLRQVHQGDVGLCQKIMMPQWNNCASFYVVAAVIQFMSMTQGTSLLEQSSLFFHCNICYFIFRKLSFLVE